MEWKKPNFRQEIQRAKKDVFDFNVYKNINKKILDMAEKESVRELSLKEKAEYDTLVNRLVDAGITAKTIPEFRALLEQIGLKTKQIEKILAHENAHANKAEEIGGEKSFKGYNINFIKSPILKKLFIPFHPTSYSQPHAIIEPPEGLSTKERADFYKKVLEAPEKYGEELSPDDIKALNKLN